MARSESWAPRKGLLALALNLCPRSQAVTAALPGLEDIRGSPVAAWLPAGPAFVLSFCNLGLGPNSQCGAVLRGLARCQVLGRGLPCPWDACVPRVETATAMKRDKPVCQGLQWKPEAGGPTPPGGQKASQKSQPWAHRPPSKLCVSSGEGNAGSRGRSRRRSDATALLLTLGSSACVSRLF